VIAARLPRFAIDCVWICAHRRRRSREGIRWALSAGGQQRIAGTG
jgi:hypothetical protein